MSDLTPGKVLLVEDPFVRGFLKFILRREGYDVLDAPADRALELIERNPSAICLIVTNSPAVFLPVCGRLPLIYLAAAPDPLLAAFFPRCRCLRKPFQPEDFVDAVHALLGAV
jgi:CheY-like chemotaxis protein